MDRDEALKLLRGGEEGVAEWNRRRKAGEEIPSLHDAELRDAVLCDAYLSEARLTGANLHGADLRRAYPSEANLDQAHVDEARLEGARLTGASLFMTDLNDVKLRGADLRAASLSRTGLRRADLRECRCWLTVFAGVDLSLVEGLEEIDHSGPSSVDHHTLTKSKAKIPEVFLRGCGLSDWEIEAAKLYDPALRPNQRMDILYQIHRLQEGQLIMYHSIFISYSHADEDFAKQLYEDLQDNRVRCWYAPRDMRGGKKIHEQLDRAIQMQGRLLLILSAASMGSNWVKTEIANARQKELEQNRNVLFPIRLVSMDEVREFKLFDADIGDDSAREVRKYHIPDFSDWKNAASYKPAFGELLRDLRKED